MYGLSAGSKKVAISRGSTVLPIQIASLSMYNYYFTTYRKIPKISPGAYIFQRPFLRGLFLEGLIFGGAYLRREISFQMRKDIYHFCFVLLCIPGQIPSTSPPGGLYLEGRFNGGFFALWFWGAYIWRGLFMEGIIFRNFTVCWESLTHHDNSDNDIGTKTFSSILCKMIALTYPVCNL